LLQEVIERLGHGWSPLNDLGNGRTRHRWKDNIRVDLRGIRWGSVDWMHLAVDKYQWWALVNIVMNPWVP
jgi:hypothetical protein